MTGAPRTKRYPRRVVLALIGLPVLIAALVVGGLLLGLVVADGLGYGGSVVFPLAFSLLGFLASLVVVYHIAKRVATGQ